MMKRTNSSHDDEWNWYQKKVEFYLDIELIGNSIQA